MSETTAAINSSGRDYLLHADGSIEDLPAHSQNPAPFEAELSQNEKDLRDCGDGTQHHRDPRCQPCAKKLFDEQEAKRAAAAQK